MGMMNGVPFRIEYFSTVKFHTAEILRYIRTVLDLSQGTVSPLTLTVVPSRWVALRWDYATLRLSRRIFIPVRKQPPESDENLTLLSRSDFSTGLSHRSYETLLFKWHPSSPDQWLLFLWSDLYTNTKLWAFVQTFINPFRVPKTKQH